MADDKNNQQQNDIPESVAARRLRVLGGGTATSDDTPIRGNFWENFWYHNKWKTIIAAASLFLLLICTMQMCTQNSYDVYLMYAGPGQLTVNETREAQNALKQLMPDYNGDGTRGVMLTVFNYLNPVEIAARKEQVEKEGLEFAFNYTENASTLERFEMEVVAGESVIYLLSPGLYASVKTAGGLIPLSEILEEIPAGAVDEYGIRLADTDFYKAVSVLQYLPEDTVLCIRRTSTMSVFKNKKKVEERHAWHVDLFRQILLFEMEPAETETAE